MQTYWYVPDPEGQDGWEHGLPPGITPEQWPRHRGSGLPLVHGFTIRVPAPYRAAGPERVALSYFHPGDAESFPPEEELSSRVQQVLDGAALSADERERPFWQALLAHREACHPAATRLVDILEHDHAILWHTEPELAAPRCPRPDEPLPDGLDGEAMHLDEPVSEAVPLRRVEQQPRNRGIQLGRPLHPVQCGEDELGFGELVLEIETDVGGANYGDGNCQIDLERGALDWACS